MHKSEKITIIGVLLNTFLFVIKIVVGLISKSTAIISDAVNSLVDVFSAISIFFAVRTSNKKPDETHPFGHDRAEPLAAFFVAILTFILGFEIAKAAVENLFNTSSHNIGIPAIVVLLLTIVIKSGMAGYYLKKGKHRPAIKAIGVDSRNDVLVSSIALLGVVGSFYGYYKLDDVAALVISIFIFNSAYDLARENIDYLMGKCPPKKQIEKLKQKTLEIKGVKGINDVRAQYVGNKIQVEIHIEVDENISTKKSHDIGKKVQKTIEKISEINKAFIHIDPV